MNRKAANGSGRSRRERTHAAEDATQLHENDDLDEARAMLLLLGKPRSKQKENGMEPKEEDEKTTTEFPCKKMAPSLTENSRNKSPATDDSRPNVSTLYHGTWPVEKNLWHSCGPNSLGGSKSVNQDASSSSVMSFSSGAPQPAQPPSPRRTYSQGHLTSKVDMVYSLLAMLGNHETREDMTKTLLALSSSPDSCRTMRQSGCLPLLVQFIHVDQSRETRERASKALHNLVHAQSDDKRGRREARVLRLLEQVRDYCDLLRETLLAMDVQARQGGPVERPAVLDDMERHPGPTIAALMKLSFDEEHRHSMCQLGGLHAIAELIQLDHEAHGSAAADQHCVTLRRYAGMALTNLTFGDGANKALLCSFTDFMRALVAQLNSPSEDLRQVTASVLRNLSWRADGASKQTLREVGAVTELMAAAMDGKKEATLKSILSALWNLSAHCSLNKVDICGVLGALSFLIHMLNYKAPSKTLAIVENAGGILRNISSHIAVREDYRAILREHKCLNVLLRQLKSPSLTIVSNACGTLWNLSARCEEDQKALWEKGAVNMLRSLVHSKHKMISMGSSAALKNLLGAKPNNNYPLDSKQVGLPALPSLMVRKQKALEQELDQNLSETCDNIEPSSSPNRDDKFVFSAMERMNNHQGRWNSQTAKYSRSRVQRSDSRDSVSSTLSDTVYERVSRNTDVLGHSGESAKHSSKASSVHGALTDNNSRTSDKKFMKRYTNSMKERGQSLESSNEDNNMLEKELIVNSEELGSPYSRLGHSDESYLEKNRDSKRVRERVQESLTASSESNTETRPIKYTNRPSSFPRNKFSDLELDATVKEEPVDYSLKYVEPNQVPPASTSEEQVDDEKPVIVNGEYVLRKKNQNDLGRGFANKGTVPANKNIKMNVVYGDYAETDLDQPTDYSLKYAEEDDLDFEKNNEAEEGSDYESSLPVHEDTLKTYYTEGTPYETPYNFSTATSMSDLRSEPTAGEEKKFDPKVKPKAPVNFHKNLDEKEAACIKLLPPPIPQADLSSGLMTPEKAVNYCVEDTPGSFSRVSSLSSLNSIPVHVDNTALAVPISPTDIVAPVPEMEQAAMPDVVETLEKEEPREGKVVTFGSTDHYAEETPLMFSRCSSLGSLSSFDQHSIHDDRSSVISDFSRRTSGIVSPSELPDSPTQTVPPSPRRTKAPVQFNLTETCRVPERQAVKPSVFEDDVAAFKEEDTPVEFSRATSLSSLTIDDEPKLTNEIVLKEVPKLSVIPGAIHHVRRTEREKEDGMEKQDVEKEKRDLLADCCELAPVSEGEEDDEDMLAACINIGMQNSRQKYKTTPPRFVRPRVSGIPMKAARSSPQQDTGTKSTAVDLPGACEDALLAYCTEGTPANISHAGSHSDLSILSIACDREESDAQAQRKEVLPELSDDSSNYSGDNENILAECIQSGMPKRRAAHSPKAQPEGKIATVVPGIAVLPLPRRSVLQCRDPPLRSPYDAMGARDEVEAYATEGSPRTFSTRSSLSDLTVSTEGGAHAVAGCLPRIRPVSEPGASCDTPLRFATEDTPLEISHAASLSSLSCGEEDNPAVKPSIKTNSMSEDIVTVLSRNGSLSSLSVDSFGSTEPTPSEQALLEQCINSGMPKSKAVRKVTNQFSLEGQMSNLQISGSSKNVEASTVTKHLAAGPGGNKSATIETKPVEIVPENMKQSTDRNTWDDDFSPNDVSFPSVSSAPLLPSNLDSASEAAMTDSRMIQVEAEKLTTVFRIQGQTSDEMEQSMEGWSMDLDAIKQPSMMDSLISLTASVSELEDRKSCHSSMMQRNRPKKKPLPAGVLVLRALGHNSMEGMLDNVSMTSTTSQIENIKPPSAMDELIDMADMENSMISVASITSEVADIAKEAACYYSASAIDNVCAPSILNDLTDMTNEAGTETICSDTEIADDLVFTHTIDDVDAPELPSDSSCRTSAESTPKKRQKHRLMTPKQKRQLVKERYKTYTITAEEERQLELERNKNEDDYVEGEEEKVKKLTPKQRRLEDRSRFETRVLDRTYTLETETKNSGIPKLRVRKNIKTLKEKRAAAKERFRTRTLSENLDPSPEQMEALIHRDANRVIHTLNETQHQSESEDLNLDCETLSLISIDSESEHHSKKRVISREVSLETDDYEEKTLKAESLSTVEDNDTLIDEERVAAGPRITIPVTTDEPVDSEVIEPVKGIRGRRKALYSAPASRRGYGINVPAKGHIPLRGSSTGGPVRPTRASALRQGRVALPVMETATKAAKPSRSVVKSNLSENVEEKSPFRPIERQGTFTKEKSPVASGSPTKTKIPVATPTDGSAKKLTEAKPALKAPAVPAPKLKLRRETSQPNPVKSTMRLAKTLSLDSNSTKQLSVVRAAQRVNAIPLRHVGIPVRPKTVDKRNVAGLRTSVSNQSLQSQRSASNSSLNSVDLVGKASGKPPKKEVASKIASLWKRVEEIQVQQRFPKKDNRVWITAEGKGDEKNAPDKLVRSSTFDGIPPKTGLESGPKKTGKPSKQNDVVLRAKKPARDDVEETTQRMSRLGSFFRLEEGKEGKPGPASAIVPPFNYSPPPRTVASSNIPTAMKPGQASLVEATATASKKVTTV